MEHSDVEESTFSLSNHKMGLAVKTTYSLFLHLPYGLVKTYIFQNNIIKLHFKARFSLIKSVFLLC